MYRVILSILLLLALSSCQQGPSLGPGDENSLATASEMDCGFVQNTYGQRVSWKKNIPVTLLIHKSFPTEYRDTLQKAAQIWSDAAGMTLFKFTEESPSDVSDKPQRDAINTVHWLQEWSEQQKNLQALTHLYWKNNLLYESDVSVDAKYFNFFLDTKQTPQDIHLESLLIHELGHVLGLKHRSTVPSVMWAILEGSSIRNALTSADRSTLKCEY